MSKTKFKYLVSFITIVLCVNFLGFTLGTNYINQPSIATIQNQNGPQKRTFNSAHNIFAKIQTDKDETDEDVEEELEECINKDLSSFNYFSHFTKSIANKSLISSKFDSKSHPYNSLNTLYIIFRVFRL